MPKGNGIPKIGDYGDTYDYTASIIVRKRGETESLKNIVDSGTVRAEDGEEAFAAAFSVFLKKHT